MQLLVLTIAHPEAIASIRTVGTGEWREVLRKTEEALYEPLRDSILGAASDSPGLSPRTAPWRNPDQSGLCGGKPS
jgi:hypothetical protein